MKPVTPRRQIVAGLERLSRDYDVPRHRHFEAYATIILKGSYEQLSYAGRLRPQAGDVLIQPTFDSHANRMLSHGIELIRLPWNREIGLGGIYRGCKIDQIRKVAAHDIIEAVQLLIEELKGRRALTSVTDDWADLLARDLASDANLHITDWARSMNLSREHVSRDFAANYATSPAQFRSELKARTALLRITGDNEPLATIAADCSFSDQAHMTRMVKAFSGFTPAQWRVTFVQDTPHLLT